MDRPELQKLLADIRAGRINTVLVTKIDRITRSLLDFYELHKTFEAHKVQFISLDESFDTRTSLGRAMLKMMLVFAELERERTSERTKESMQSRAERGLWNGGRVLGYSLDPNEKGVLKVDEEEAALVRLIFDQYLQLGSAREVALFLNERGHRTPEYFSRREKRQGGKKFEVGQVNGILSNPVYVGMVRLRGKPFKGRHERIIDEETFQAAQDLRARNRAAGRSVLEPVNHTFILEGLVRCGHCGSAMTPHYASKKGQHFNYYRCVKEIKQGKAARCPVRSVNALEIEKLVLDRIAHLSTQEKHVAEVLEAHRQRSTEATGPIRDQIAALQGQLKTATEQATNILAVVKDGKAGAQLDLFREQYTALEERRSQLKGEIEKLERQLQDLVSKEDNTAAVLDVLRNFRQHFDKAPGHLRKDLMKTLIDRIVYHGDKLELWVFDDLEELGIALREEEEPPDGSGGSGAAGGSRKVPVSGGRVRSRQAAPGARYRSISSTRLARRRDWLPTERTQQT